MSSSESNKRHGREARYEEFLALWLRHESQIYGMIFSLVPDWSDADDLVQEVSLVLWRRFDEFQSGTSFLAWAFKTAHFQVMAFRKKQRASRVRFSTETVERLAGDVASVFEDESATRQEALSRCLGRLRPRDRELVRLRYQSGATTDSLSKALGKTSTAIYKALSRVHTRLLNCIEGYLHSSLSG